MQSKVFLLKRISRLILFLLISLGLLYFWFNLDDIPGREGLSRLNPLIVENIQFSHDQNGDGINDMDDILLGAKQDAERKPKYKSTYYAGGYPPDDEGVCTDVIWRSFMNAGYSLKELVDQDIKQYPKDYPRVGDKPDPNIDFRRVPNLADFFRKYGDSLTIQVIPGNLENLKEWQRGDIVVFDKPVPHIGIISDKRRPDGVPYIIHNCGPYTMEADVLQSWSSPISGHFRFPSLIKIQEGGS